MRERIVNTMKDYVDIAEEEAVEVRGKGADGVCPVTIQLLMPSTACRSTFPWILTWAQSTV